MDHIRWLFEQSRHYERWARRVTTRYPLLVCQECRGRGGHIEPVLDFGQGPWEDCGYCEGTGYLDEYRRALWLRHQREMKRVAKERAA